MKWTLLCTATVVAIASGVFADEPPVPEAIAPSCGELPYVSQYVIDPPDVVSIELLKPAAKSPYRAAVFDVLQIRADARSESPLSAWNFYLIETEGTIDLGPPWGNVRVAGMTREEITKAIDEHLKTWIAKPGASVKVARVADERAVTGLYLVGHDGTINLRQYGVVNIGGKKVAEAKDVIESRLKSYFDSPEVSIEVSAYNSKSYYVVTHGAGLGDKLRRLPITGNDTVLDAVSEVVGQIKGGPAALSGKKMWIMRPAPREHGCEQILKVDWDGITQGAETATNYSLLPGDRLYVVADRNEIGDFFARCTSAVERLVRIAGLTRDEPRNAHNPDGTWNGL